MDTTARLSAGFNPTDRLEAVLAKVWAGIDAGKAHHHCVVIDADENRLLSQKISNDEPAQLELIAAVLKLGDGDEVVWATDLNHGGPALLMALLVAHGQRILYIPGPDGAPHLQNLPRRG
jgi:hypothetical protein